MILSGLRNRLKKIKYGFSIAAGLKSIAIMEFPARPLQRFLFVFRTFPILLTLPLKPYLCASNK